MADAAPKLEDTQEYKDLEASKATVFSLDKQREASIKSEGDILAAQRQEIEPAVKETQGLIAEQQKRLAEPPPEAPKLGTPPKVSDYFNKDVGTMLLTAATLVAGIGAGAGRVRGIRAMNSLAGGINGYVAGNLQAAHDGIQDYANQMEAQIKEYQLLTERSNNIITRGGMSIQNKLNELQLLKAVHGMMLDEETVKQKGIDAQIQDTMHLNEITARLMTATNQANTLKEKIREADMRNQAELARIAEERQYHQGMLDVQREKRESALLDKPAQAGFYYDKNQRGFMTDRPTVGEVKDQPSRFVRMSTQDKATMTFLDYAIGQMEGIHDLANKVLGQGPVMGPLAAVTAKYRKGKGAQDMADFVGTRARLLTEGTRLETGGNRILKDVLNNVRDQFPDAGTDPDVARRKLTSLKTAFEQRVHGMIGREPLTTEKSDEIYFELTGHLKGDQLQKALKDPEVRKQAEKIARDRGYDW